MKIHPIAAFASALALTASAHAQAPSSERFQLLDANSDGFVTREEAGALSGFDAAFNEGDENRDGRLDVTEFIKADAYYGRLRTGAYVDDGVLTAKVKTALLRERGLKSMDVNVETNRGRVLLSGWVENEEQRKRALNVARHVEGVVEVRDGMNVR